MENRFQHNSPEEQEGWGAYVTPPVYGSELGKLCVDVRKLLPELLENDGGVRPEMATAIYGHLAVCPGCAREFDEMQQLVNQIEALPEVDLPMDYSSLIMRRIQAQPETIHHDAHATAGGQAAVRQVTKAVGTQTETRTTSGVVTQAGVSAWQRLSLGALLSGLLTFFLSSAWGREMLGATSATVAAWLEQVGDMVSRIPILGYVIGLILVVLSEAGQLLSETYQSLGSLAVQGLAIDIALGALVYGVVRRQRQHRAGV